MEKYNLQGRKSKDCVSAESFGVTCPYQERVAWAVPSFHPTFWG